jgi:hypothetical protein
LVIGLLFMLASSGFPVQEPGWMSDPKRQGVFQRSMNIPYTIPASYPKDIGPVMRALPVTAHYLSDRDVELAVNTATMSRTLMTSASPGLLTFSPSLQVFFYLQLLDALTTLLGFRAGLVEGSPIVRMLANVGPVAGLLADKMFAVLLAGICVWSGRSRMIRWINYWYAALVIWNILLILLAAS